MSKSPNLKLPYIKPAQAQKHVTHNEALRYLDALIQLSVVTRDLSAPPAQPAEGSRYLIAENAQGLWEGHEGEIAAFQDSAWYFIIPQTGWLMWVSDEKALIIYDGAGWITGAETDEQSEEMKLLGVNAQPDETNRFVVKSDAVLLSHDDVTPGSGDVRVVVNKQTSEKTGSFLFQNNYSGRAEIGLTGGDDFQMNVSEDGTNWKTALKIDAQSGVVSLPNSAPPSPHLNILKDSGRFTTSPDPQSALVGAFQSPSYLSPYNGAVFEQGPQFFHNNATYGGSRPELDPLVDELISSFRGLGYRRYGVEFHTMKITAGAGVSGSVNSPNGRYYLTIVNKSMPLPPQMSVSFYLRVQTGDALVRRLGRLFVGDVEIQNDVHLVEASDGWILVTHLMENDTFTTAGYDPALMRIYSKSGAVLYLAAMVLSPGHLPVSDGAMRGIIPSLDSWR